MNSQRFNIEKYIFLIITLLNLLPVFAGKFFPTLDGAAHLYNSTLVNSLLFEDNHFIERFYVLNNLPVPNWTGHFLLSTFNYFLPAYVSEKILLLIYLVGLPYAFRSLIKTVSPENYFLSYFIFPFTYSLFFFLGFYNFSIAVMLSFLILNFWIRNETKLLSTRKILFLSSFLLLTYFSHLFVFILLLFLIAFRILFLAAFEIQKNKNNFRRIISNSFRTTGVLLLSSFIPLMLSLIYFLSIKSSEGYTFLSYSELIECLLNVRPLIAINYSFEEVFSKIIFYLLVVLMFLSVSFRIRKYFSPGTHSEKSSISGSAYWIISAFLILIMFFTLPDYDGSAGFITLRLELFFFLFIIVWLSTQKLPVWLGIISVTVVLYCSIRKNSFYYDQFGNLNSLVNECIDVSEHIKPNSIVLPLNYSDNWLVKHFSNYLGVEKPMIILENYESDKGYFPVNWNRKSKPNLLVGSQNLNSFLCFEWKTNIENPVEKIDYVFIIGNPENVKDSCNTALLREVVKDYRMIYQTENCRLYVIREREKLTTEARRSQRNTEKRCNNYNHCLCAPPCNPCLRGELFFKHTRYGGHRDPQRINKER